MMQNTKSPLLTFLFSCLIAFPIFSQAPDSLTLCSSGNAQILYSTAANGVFYDSGGPFNYYNNYEDCGLLISPGCAESITIDVSYYSTEYGYEWLRFYDGTDGNAPLLLDMQYLFGPQTVTLYSGSVFVSWHSDYSNVADGFRVTWTSSLVAPTPPEIDLFTASETNPPLLTAVQFNAGATNYPLVWNWDFDDPSSGTNTSTEQNPSHIFSTSGQHTVRLIVSNCFGLSDTAEQLILVQDAPAVMVDPGSLEVTLACSSTIEATLNLINTGQGDLHFQYHGSDNGNKVRPLIYTYTAFYYSTDGLANALATYSSDYDLLFSAETDSATFAAQLADRDVLIFPDIPPSFDSYVVLNGLRGAILDFVNAGGSIIFCGQEYGGNVLPLTGLLSSDFNSNFVHGSTISLQPHPITDGVGQDYYLNYASIALKFTNPDYVSLAEFNGYSWLGYREVGNAKVIYLGSNFNQYDFALGQMLHNALQWCGSRGGITLSPDEGEIAPGDTLQVAIQFSAKDLYAGDYFGTLNFETNDPAQASLSVPYTLHVQGVAALVASPDALDFGIQQQFSQSNQAVTISNTGCDTLFIQNIATSSAAYNVSPQQLTVLPYTDGLLSVTFEPQDTGWQAAYLILESNVGVDSLSLSAYSVGAPDAEVNPQSLSAALTCGDSISLPLTITNTGLGDLEVHIGGTGANQGTSDLKILSIFQGAFNSFVAERTEQAIAARFPQAVLSRFENQDISELPNLLNGQDIVVVPFLGSFSDALYIQIGQALAPFVQAGGGLIFAGTNNPAGLNAYGFLQCAPDIYDAFTQPLEAIEPQHPILQGVDLLVPAPDNLFAGNFSSPGFEPLAKVPGLTQTAVGVQFSGSGKIVYIGHVFGNQNEEVLDMLENAIKWCQGQDWLSGSPNSFTVPPGSSTTIEVKFNASGLSENTYTANLTLSTNDPAHPVITIPCTMVVDGEPNLEGLQPSLDFGIIQQFTLADLFLPVKNSGCDTLNVTSVSSDNPIFHVLNFDPVALPDQSGNVQVRFAPQVPGNYSAVLTLVTDAGTFTVALSGTAVGAPAASVNPSSIVVNLASCDESVTQSITLSNNGLGNMNYQVGNLQSHRNVLAIRYGANPFRWDNLRNFILLNVPNVSLSEYGGNLSSSLAAEITQKNIDVLIVPSMDIDNDPVYAAFAPVIHSFLQSGGQVLAMGAYNPGSLEQMGLFELIGTNYSFNPIARISDKAHRLTAGVEENHQVYDNCYLAAFPFGEVHPVALSPNIQNIYLGFRQTGLGNVVYWSQVFDYVDNTAIPIVKNIFGWFSNPVPSGIDVSGISGILPVGGSVQLPVIFSGQNLSGGQYSGQIQVYTNDPMHNPLIVPVTLNMSYKPCADFSSVGSPCSGTLNFSDEGLNTANSWLWQFGDGGTATVQNPSHTYNDENIYTVTLIACNSFGCDTVTKPVEVLSINGPKLPNCNPQTLGPCCDAGIHRVKIGFLDHSSGDAASEGYEDFSCSEGTELMAGIQFPLAVVTGSQNTEYVRGWIDLNNNGVFTDNEQIINDQANPTHISYFTPPINAVKDVPLRMRIMSESIWAGQISGPCSNLTYGQCEDYYVVIKTTVNTTEPGEEMSTRVYPNPSAGETWLEFNLPEAQPVRLKIADQMGRIVWENNIEDAAAGLNRLQLPPLPAGTYALAVQSGTSTRVEKVVQVERP